MHQHAGQGELVPRDAPSLDHALAEPVTFQTTRREDDEAAVEIDRFDRGGTGYLKVATALLVNEAPEHLRQWRMGKRADEAC